MGRRGTCRNVYSHSGECRHRPRRRTYRLNERGDSATLTAFCGETDLEFYDKDHDCGYVQVRVEASTYNSRHGKERVGRYATQRGPAERFFERVLADVRRHKGRGLKAMLLGESVEISGLGDDFAPEFVTKLNQIGASHFSVIHAGGRRVNVSRSDEDVYAAWLNDLERHAPRLALSIYRSCRSRDGLMLSKDFGADGPGKLVRLGVVKVMARGQYALGDKYYAVPEIV